MIPNMEEEAATSWLRDVAFLMTGGPDQSEAREAISLLDMEDILLPHPIHHTVEYNMP